MMTLNQRQVPTINYPPRLLQMGRCNKQLTANTGNTTFVSRSSHISLKKFNEIYIYICKKKKKQQKEKSVRIWWYRKE